MDDIASQRAEVAAKVRRWGKKPLVDAAGLNRGTLTRFLDGDDLLEQTRSSMVEAVRALPDAPPPRRRRSASAVDTIETDAFPDGRDPAEELPGYWLGYLAGVRRTMDRATRELEHASAELLVMIRAGHRWEAATVRAAARKAAEAAALAQGGRAAPDPAALAAQHAREEAEMQARHAAELAPIRSAAAGAAASRPAPDQSRRPPRGRR